MWANFSAEIKHLNGTTVEVSPCEMFYPGKRKYLEIQIEIPASVLPKSEAAWGRSVSKTLREIAAMLDQKQLGSGGKKSAKSNKA